MIRQATEEDLGFMVDVARERYSDFPIEAAVAYGKQAIDSPSTLVLVGDYGFCIMAMTRFFFEPQVLRARMVFLATRQNSSWEGYKLLKAAVLSARNMGAIVHLGSDSEFDLAPFAIRLGGKVDRPSFVIGVQ